MLKKFVTILGGDPNKRAINQAAEIIEQVNSLEAQFEALDDGQLRGYPPSYCAKSAPLRRARSSRRRWALR